MAVHIVHVVADRVAQSLLFKSSVFRPQVDLKVRPMDGYHETLIILIKTMTCNQSITFEASDRSRSLPVALIQILASELSLAPIREIVR